MGSAQADVADDPARQAALGQFGQRAAPGSPLDIIFQQFGQIEAQQILQILLDDISSGVNPRALASDMRGVLDDASYGRAATIARTETLTSWNDAALENYRANSDIIGSWMWVCMPGAGTCVSCLEEDGTIYSLDEELDDHPNGRCCKGPVTSDYSDILSNYGIDAGEEDVGPGPWDDRMSGEEWLLEQDAETQRQAFGSNAAFNAWKVGDAKLSDFVKIRHDPVWGDSIQQQSLKGMGLKASDYGVGTAKAAQAAQELVPQAAKIPELPEIKAATTAEDVLAAMKAEEQRYKDLFGIVMHTPGTLGMEDAAAAIVQRLPPDFNYESLRQALDITPEKIAWLERAHVLLPGSNLDEYTTLRLLQEYHAFAGGTATGTPFQVLLQEAAEREFGLTSVQKYWTADKLAAALDQYGEVIPGVQQVLRAMYDNTQAWFQEHGISEITLYRGESWTAALRPKGFTYDATVHEQELILKPLSSWSTTLKVGSDYAQGEGDVALKAYGAIERMQIPVESVLSVPGTGFGANFLQEVLVLGNKYDAEVLALKTTAGSLLSEDAVFDALAKASVREVTTAEESAGAVVRAEGGQWIGEKALQPPFSPDDFTTGARDSRHLGGTYGAREVTIGDQRYVVKEIEEGLRIHPVTADDARYQAHAEAAVTQIAKLLGMKDHVVDTYAFELDGKQYVVSKYAKDTRVLADIPKGALVLDKITEQQLSDTMLLDYLTGDSDRLAGNYLVTKLGRLIEIDSGDAFTVKDGIDIQKSDLRTLWASRLGGSVKDAAIREQMEFSHATLDTILSKEDSVIATLRQYHLDEGIPGVQARYDVLRQLAESGKPTYADLRNAVDERAAVQQMHADREALRIQRDAIQAKQDVLSARWAKIVREADFTEPDEAAIAEQKLAAIEKQQANNITKMDKLDTKMQALDEKIGKEVPSVPPETVQEPLAKPGTTEAPRVEVAEELVAPGYASRVNEDVPDEQYQKLVGNLKDNPDFQKLAASFYPNETPEHQIGNMAYRFTDHWAGSANDMDVVALKYAVRDELGLVDAAPEFADHTPDVLFGDPKGERFNPYERYQENAAGYRAYARAQYEVTQDYLREQNISSLTLYRGSAYDTLPKKSGIDWGHSGETELSTRALSPWTVDPSVATTFADGYPYQLELSADVPASRIFSFAATGPGTDYQYEVLLVGGTDKFSYVSRVDEELLAASKAGTEATAEGRFSLGTLDEIKASETQVERLYGGLPIGDPQAMQEAAFGNNPFARLGSPLQGAEPAMVAAVERGSQMLDEAIGKLATRLEDNQTFLRFARYMGYDSDRIGVQMTSYWNAKRAEEAGRTLSEEEAKLVAMTRAEAQVWARQEALKETVYDIFDAFHSIPAGGDELFVQTPLQISMQEAVKAEFKLKDAAGYWSDEAIAATKAEWGTYSNGIRAFMRGMYDETQAYFREQGITEIQLFRGLRWTADKAPTDIAFDGRVIESVVQQAPMTSWASSPEVALDYARDIGGAARPATQAADYGMVLATKVPVDQLLSTPFTGFGTPTLREMILLGKPDDALALPFTMDHAPTMQEFLDRLASPATPEAKVAEAATFTAGDMGVSALPSYTLPEIDQKAEAAIIHQAQDVLATDAGVASHTDALALGQPIQQYIDQRIGPLADWQQEATFLRDPANVSLRTGDQMAWIAHDPAALADHGGMTIEQVAQQYAEVVQSEVQRLLPEVRDVGGVDLAVAKGGDAAVVDAVRQVQDLLPTDWLQLSNDQGRLIAVEGSATRGGVGFYAAQPNGGGKVVVQLEGASDAQVQARTIHELAHRMEDVVPGLWQLERDFYDARTAGEDAVKLTEDIVGTTKLDRWSWEYLGRTPIPISFPGEGGVLHRYESYELLSNGLQFLMAGDSSMIYFLQRDPEYYHFILGVLFGAKGIPAS